jgi:hypothetical protein
LALHFAPLPVLSHALTPLFAENRCHRHHVTPGGPQEHETGAPTPSSASARARRPRSAVARQPRRPIDAKDSLMSTMPISSLFQSKQHHKRRSVVRARSFSGDAPPRLSGGAAALSAPVTKLHRPLSAIGSSTNGVDQNPRTPSAPVHHGPVNQPREHRSTSPRPRHGHVICSS